MAGRDFLFRGEPGFSLPAFDRLASPPPPDLLTARIEAHTSPGDLVVDLYGRGGWVARSAVDHQRRAITFESSPLTRLLAEVVLRPPDVRHLDAAFQGIAAAPRHESSLKVSLGDLFATKCATCGRAVVADEFIWEGSPADAATGAWARAERTADEPAPADAASRAWVGPRPIRRQYRCIVCRDQLGGGEHRHAPVEDADLAKATKLDGADEVRRVLRDRFPTLDGDDLLVEQLLDLHSPRQLLGLGAILARIEADLRAAPVEAALRLALLHALLPASRLNGFPGRVASLRISGGRVKLPSGGQWRERNPWLAFEDGFRLVRGFVQRLEGSTLGPVQARFGEDIRSLAEGAATVAVRVGSPLAFRALHEEASALQRSGGRPRARLVLSQPPLRPNQERLSYAYYATAMVLGREAASTLAIEPLYGSIGRAPWGWQSAALRRSFEAIRPLLANDARIVLLLEAGGAEALVSAVLGGVGAGYRVGGARLGDQGEEIAGAVEFRLTRSAIALDAPSGGGSTLGPGARTRANVPLEALPRADAGAELAPGRGLFAPPERFDRLPFSAADASRTVTEIAVEILRARGEPASSERLLGEILVGLDRTGQLHRFVAASEADDRPGGDAPAHEAPTHGAPAREATTHEATTHEAPADRALAPTAPPRESDARPVPADRPIGPPVDGSAAGGRLLRETARPRRDAVRDAGDLANDRVEALLELIRAELARSGNRRLRELEPGRWWLAAREDRAAAALPLADRVEWAVFSLLSTAGRLSEAAFFERIAALFTGHDLPDEPLVRACLESYRSMASTADRLLTADDLLRRSHEHGELIALLADTGHALGMRVWIGAREQTRRIGGQPLGDWLDDKERNVHLPLIARAPLEALEQVDCIWYVRNKATLMFEVEWTAMFGEPVLRRHAQIPQDEQIVRFLVIAPERTELVRYKLERSPLLRQALAAGNWHFLKANHLRAFAAREAPSLSDLEPLLGLDPPIERQGEQLSLFNA